MFLLIFVGPSIKILYYENKSIVYRFPYKGQRRRTSYQVEEVNQESRHWQYRHGWKIRGHQNALW